MRRTILRLLDIGFDREARTVAVLTFRADKQLGWHLDTVVACQALSPTPRTS